MRLKGAGIQARTYSNPATRAAFLTEVTCLPLQIRHSNTYAARRRSFPFREVSAPQNEQRRKIEELGGGKHRGAHKSEERGEKGEILADGPQQHVEDQRQRNIAHGFYQVAGEAHAEQRVKGLDVLRCGGRVARY